MTKTQTVDEAEVREGYRSFNSRQLARGLMVLSAISVLIVPGGFVLDYFIYPQRFGAFLALRFGCALLLLGVIGVLYRLQSSGKLPLIKAIGIFSAVLVNATMCYMIYLTDGARSPYFVGLTLVLTCWSILSPWTAVETIIMCLVSLTIFILACVANPGFSQEGVAPLLGFGSFFILITSIACVSITFFLSGVRFQDFRLRHQLDVQNRELQDLDRVKTQFFSNVSHELRTPLTLILGPVETLLARPDVLDAKVHQGLLLIHRNTLRLLKLINDLLELTRLDQNADLLRKSKITLGVFVRGIVESVRHLGLSKQLRIRVEEADPGLTVMADPSRIEKVLINLLTNAIKYTPAGGTITVRWSGNASEVCIEVQDTGVGIPPEDLPRIFDRFHQVRGNAANLTQGVGIGLALARELVERHGGKLEVESELEKGATFRMRLPVGDESEAGEAVESHRGLRNGRTV
jgi:signal transduction histidine kinase